MEGEIPNPDQRLPSVLQEKLLRGDRMWRFPDKGEKQQCLKKGRISNLSVFTKKKQQSERISERYPMSMSFGRGPNGNLRTVTINHLWISFKALSKGFLSPSVQGWQTMWLKGSQLCYPTNINIRQDLYKSQFFVAHKSPTRSYCCGVTLKRICTILGTFHKWQKF